jgi:hypothetical protein
MIWAEYYLPGFSEYFECLFEPDATSCGLEPMTRANGLLTVKGGGNGSGLLERVHAIFVNAIMKSTPGQSIDFLKNNENILANLNSCLGYITSLQEAIGDLHTAHTIAAICITSCCFTDKSDQHRAQLLDMVHSAT